MRTIVGVLNQKNDAIWVQARKRGWSFGRRGVDECAESQRSGTRAGANCEWLSYRLDTYTYRMALTKSPRRCGSYLAGLPDTPYMSAGT